VHDIKLKHFKATKAGNFKETFCKLATHLVFYSSVQSHMALHRQDLLYIDIMPQFLP